MTLLFGYLHTYHSPHRPTTRQIVSSRIAIDVEDFASEEKSWDQERLSCLGIDFGEGDAAGRDELVARPTLDERERYSCTQQVAEAAAIFFFEIAEKGMLIYVCKSKQSFGKSFGEIIT